MAWDNILLKIQCPYAEENTIVLSVGALYFQYVVPQAQFNEEANKIVLVLASLVVVLGLEYLISFKNSNTDK